MRSLLAVCALALTAGAAEAQTASITSTPETFQLRPPAVGTGITAKGTYKMGAGQTFSKVMVEIEKWDGVKWVAMPNNRHQARAGGGNYDFSFSGVVSAGKYRVKATLYRMGLFGTDVEAAVNTDKGEVEVK